MKNDLAEPCHYNELASSGRLGDRNAAMEVGCPLDHCGCGTHDVEGEYHECKEPEYDELAEEIRHAEMMAGWDPNP